MDIRRILLILSAGAVSALLAQSLTNVPAVKEVRSSAAQNPELERADRMGRPGEIIWSNFEEPSRTRTQANVPRVRDVLADEMRYADLPEKVRERLERDFKGLDVALPRRSPAAREGNR